MRIQTRKTEIRYTGDIYVVTGLQTASETIAGLEADAVGTLGVSTFSTTTGKFTSTTTKGDITTGNPKFKLSYKDGDGVIATLAEMSKDEIIVEKSAYKAPVKQVTTIGYTAAGGTLNYTTAVTGDEMILRITNTTETGAGLPYDTVMPYQVVATASDTPYSMLSKLVAQINLDNSFQHNEYDFIAPYAATIVSNNVVTTALGQAAVVVNGSAVVTSTGHNELVGAFLRLAGDVYRIVAVATNLITLDRPYAGASATIASGTNTLTQAQNIGATEPTDLGFTLTTTEFGESFSVALDGVLQEASNTLTTNYTLGSGSGAEVKFIEETNHYRKGNPWRNEERTREYPEITTLANTASFYTLYKISNKNSNIARADRFKTNIWLYIAQADASTVSTVLDLLLP